MKKEKTVKAYTRRTKSGKTVVVKQHTAKYDAAEEKAMTKKRGAGGEFEGKRQINVVRQAYNLLEALSDGDKPTYSVDDVCNSISKAPKETRNTIYTHILEDEHNGRSTGNAAYKSARAKIIKAIGKNIPHGIEKKDLGTLKGDTSKGSNGVQKSVKDIERLFSAASSNKGYLRIKKDVLSNISKIPESKKSSLLKKVDGLDKKYSKSVSAFRRYEYPAVVRDVRNALQGKPDLKTSKQPPHFLVQDFLLGGKN